MLIRAVVFAAALIFRNTKFIIFGNAKYSNTLSTYNNV